MADLSSVWVTAYLAIAAATSAPAPSIPPNVVQARPTGTFFAVSVRDLRASVEWYAAAFGLRAGPIQPGPDGILVCLLEGDGVLVELVHVPSAEPFAVATPRAKAVEYVHGLFKAGVMVDDFDGLLAGLRERRVATAYGPFPPRGGPAGERHRARPRWQPAADLRAGATKRRPLRRSGGGTARRRRRSKLDEA